MDLRLTAAEAAFRDELVEWLHSVLPTLPARPPERDYWARREFDTHWQQQLHAAGYAGVNWPKEFGGRGLTGVEVAIMPRDTFFMKPLVSAIADHFSG